MMSAQTIQPVQERLVALDVLRGFALFGILLVNMLDFSGSALRMGTLGMRGSPIDQFIDIGIVFFAMTKFYLLFSFLFGVGFAVQMRRAESGGRPFVGFYLRRLVILFIIGAAHAILLWEGDILHLYALAGLLLLLVRHLSTRVLLALALLIASAGLIFFGMASDTHQVSSLMDAESIRLFSTGTYGDLVNYRFNQETVLDIQVPMVLVMFLVGLAVGRDGLLDQPERYKPFLRRWWKWALLVGLTLNASMLLGYEMGNAWFVSIGVHIGAPALGFVYLSAVLLNAEKLRWLAPAGQMALSNYLSHSLICTTLFYGYGLGWYDRLSPLTTTLLVILIFGAQVIVSDLWMQRYRFGLMEWLWRSLSYGQWQPIRRLV
jgi:uncharacterized protein